MTAFDLGGDPLTLGIDPGKGGALAFLGPDGDLRHIEDMPPLTGAGLGAAVAGLLADLAPDFVTVAWVEQVHAMPKQGVTSTWTFAEGHGAVLGALGALGVRVELVPASHWKKKAGLAGKDKRASLDAAARHWPGSVDLFRRAKDDGRAEAALIARHGQGADS